MMKKLMVVLIVAVVAALHTSDSIPVKSEEFAEQIRRIVGMSDEVFADSVRNERATKVDRFCYDTPCGWYAFHPQTRRSTEFVRNRCKCPDETYNCVRTDENVSIGAYVYYCRQNATVEDVPPDYIG